MPAGPAPSSRSSACSPSASPVRRTLSVAATGALRSALLARAVGNGRLVASDGRAMGALPSILWVMDRSWGCLVEHCNGARAGNLNPEVKPGLGRSRQQLDDPLGDQPPAQDPARGGVLHADAAAGL